VSAEIFPGWQRRNLTYPFQVADDAMQMNVHKARTLSNPLVCAWASEIFFAAGPLRDFSKVFFQEGAKSGEISFFPIKTKKKSFFC